MTITAHGYDDKHGYFCIDTHPAKTYAQRITGFIFSHELEEYIALHSSDTHPCLSLKNNVLDHIERGVILGKQKLNLRWQRCL